MRLVGLEELARMRLEYQRAGRGAKLAADCRCRAQERLVAAVHAVEVADGQHGPTRRDRHIPVAVNDLHRATFASSVSKFRRRFLACCAA